MQKQLALRQSEADDLMKAVQDLERLRVEEEEELVNVREHIQRVQSRIEEIETDLRSNYPYYRFHQKQALRKEIFPFLSPSKSSFFKFPASATAAASSSSSWTSSYLLSTLPPEDRLFLLRHYFHELRRYAASEKMIHLLSLEKSKKKTAAYSPLDLLSVQETEKESIFSEDNFNLSPPLLQLRLPSSSLSQSNQVKRKKKDEKEEEEELEEEEGQEDRGGIDYPDYLDDTKNEWLSPMKSPVMSIPLASYGIEEDEEDY
eukprot:scaffold61_cov180-Ochromonas_danica.AAC.33